MGRASVFSAVVLVIAVTASFFSGLSGDPDALIAPSIARGGSVGIDQDFLTHLPGYRASVDPTIRDAHSANRSGETPDKATPTKASARPVLRPLPYVAIALAEVASELQSRDSFASLSEAMAAPDAREEAERDSADRVASDVGGRVRHHIGSLRGWWLLEFDDSDSAARASESLSSDPRVRTAIRQYANPKRKRTNDAYFSQQWHLKNTGQLGRLPNFDLNVEPAWANSYTGLGVRIGMFDDGVDFTNPDLASAHYAAASYDFEFNVADGSPKDLYDDHGTATAGIAGARANNVVGVASPAYASQLSSLRALTYSMNDASEAAALGHMSQALDIYSNSWGPPDYGDYEHPGPLTTAAIINGANVGRAGKGSIYVWAGGNGDIYDDANYDGYANMPETISVPAMTGNGTHWWMSEPGACHLVAGMADDLGVLTTDRVGADGYNYGQAGELADMNYSSGFSGTSASAPMITGIIAQMLQAKPALTWRDVQHILVRSARKFDPTNSSWQTNGAGYTFSHQWGFGLANSAAATSLAAQWTNVPPRQLVQSPSLAVNQTIPESSIPLVLTHTVTTPFHCEHVQVRIETDHTFWGDLVVILTSPSGTVSTLATEHYGNRGGAFTGNAWHYMSVAHWGEPALGQWTMSIRDGLPADSGILQSWRLIIHGTSAQPGPTGGGGAPVIAAQALPSGTVGIPYSAQIVATGGDGGPYQWSVSMGNLPPGLSLNPTSGAITGTPTSNVPSQYSFVIRAEDAKGNDNQNFSITIYGASLAISAPAGATLPPGSVNVAYTAILASSGGTGTIRTWSITPALPAGLTLAASTGVIVGTPTTAGTTSHTLSVTDGASNTVNKPVVLAIYPVLTVISPSGGALPDAGLGKSYTANLGATGGAGTVRSWSVWPSIPPGLAVNTFTGAVTGTPTAAGSYTLTFTVIDAVSAPASRIYTLTVHPALEIASSAIEPAAVGFAYAGPALSAAGGNGGPYTWSVFPALPSGMTFSTVTGEIAGTPTSPSTTTHTFGLQDGVSNAVLKQLAFVIETPQPRFSSLSAAAAGTVGPGMVLEVSRSIMNIGYASGSCSYSLYLTQAATVAAGDYLIHTGSVSLAGRARSDASDSVVLPLGIPSGDYRVGVIVSGSTADPATDRATSPWELVEFTEFLHTIAAPSVSCARAVDATVTVPVSLQNHLLPLARSIEFILAASTPHLIYDNQVTVATGVNVSAVPQLGGGVRVQVNLATPFTDGDIVSLRFRVGTTAAPQAPAAIHDLTISDILIRSAENTVLGADGAVGQVTFSNHRLSVPTVAAEATPGTIFTVPIAFENLTQEALVGSVSFTLSLDSTKIEHVGTIPEASIANRTVNANVASTTNGIALTVSIGANGMVGLTSGELLTLRFRVLPSGGAVGSFAATLGAVQANDNTTQTQPILVGTTDGRVSLAPFSPKDINVDGIIDVVDVQTAVNLILGLATPRHTLQGDANGDGVVDVVDVQTIVNCILSLGPCQ